MNYIILFIYLMQKPSKCIAVLHCPSGGAKSASMAGFHRPPAASANRVAISHPFRTGGGADPQICRLQRDQRRNNPSCLIAPISSHRTTGVFLDSTGVATD